MKVHIQDLTKSFNKKIILNKINFEFQEGKIYGLLGKNGAGKTTLFNCINQDLKFESGEIQISIDNQTRELKTEEIGYVVSTPVVPDFLTAQEFIKFFIDINKDKLSNLKSIDEYFKMIDICKEDQNKLLKDYSHGMKNKIQMLVNIISEPKLLLLDEPLTSFDVVVAEEMKKMLKDLKKDRIIIFSTHILELAIDLCDEIVYLDNGVLSTISTQVKDKESFKETILTALKGDNHVESI